MLDILGATQRLNLTFSLGNLRVLLFKSLAKLSIKVQKKYIFKTIFKSFLTLRIGRVAILNMRCCQYSAQQVRSLLFLVGVAIAQINTTCVRCTANGKLRNDDSWFEPAVRHSDQLRNELLSYAKISIGSQKLVTQT